MKVSFKWIGGASFILTVGDLRIAADPVLCEKSSVLDFFWFKSMRTEQPLYSEEDFNTIDLWLLTHNHEDHIDKKGVSMIHDSAEIICNKNSSALLNENGLKGFTLLKWNQTAKQTIRGYTVTTTAVPATHGINPLAALLAGKGNGYYLSISKDDEIIQVYISGDTVYNRRTIKALQNKNIDLFISNMGAAKQGSWIMSLTLNAEMLKKMIAKLNPKIIIPVHYGTFTHYKEPVEAIEKLNDNRISILKTGSTTEINIP